MILIKLLRGQATDTLGPRQAAGVGCPAGTSCIGSIPDEDRVTRTCVGAIKERG